MFRNHGPCAYGGVDGRRPSARRNSQKRRRRTLK
eukprot:COSAG06_NODE_60345_length_271_cov_0.598837_1_plen_33_part_01